MTDLALSSAVSSLLILEKQMGVASNNVANANTVGYSRETVQVAERVAGGVGTGVTDLGTVSNVDQYLQAAVIRANGQSAQATAYNTLYQNLAQALGQITTSDTGGNDLASQLGTLQASLTQLGNTPENNSLNTQVIGNLDDLLSNLRTLSSQIQQLRNTADSQISDAVTDANNQLNSISRLNKQIQQATALGQSVASLNDQRATALQSLTADLNVSYYTDSSGAMQIYTSGGQPLLIGDAVVPLSHSAAAIGATSSYQSDGEGGIGGIFAGSADITSQITSGKLDALVQQRDVDLPDAQNSLNKLAQSLSSALNNVYSLATTSAPSSSLTGATTTFTAASPLFAAPGTTLRVAALDSKGAVSGYVDVDISGANSVSQLMTDINTASASANPPLSVSASLTGSPGALQFSSTGAAGTGVNIATISGSISGTALSASNPGVDVASYFGIPVPGPNNLVVGGNSATTIAVTPAILANPGANFINGNGTMGAMLADVLLNQQNFSAATATGSRAQASTLAAINLSASTFTINGGSSPITVTVPAGSTLSGVVAAINAAAGGSSGVHAAITPTPNASSGNGPFSLQITASGSQVTFSGVSGDLLTQLGMSSAPTGYLATTSATFAGFATNLISDVATRASTAKADATAKSTTLTAMQSNLSAQSGVNVDEEMANLTTLQNAYAASAKIVTTVNSMFQSLLQAVGA